ncbi:unnamed protein product [Paramecium sonneborni]|uniref:Uncharacterized protein n=1 Tax=Paramecium sonneborni TaxID=65129 RepID=A0A8S1P6I6_9CILI|nr:unnamed protein product [Paramecium sonneborni]
MKKLAKLESMRSKLETLNKHSIRNYQIIEQLQLQLKDMQSQNQQIAEDYQNNFRNTLNQFSSNKKLSKIQDNEKDQVIQELNSQLKEKNEENHQLKDFLSISYYFRFN